MVSDVVRLRAHEDYMLPGTPFFFFAVFFSSAATQAVLCSGLDIEFFSL